MQISMSHMNSRTGWYLILRKTITVLLVQQNSAKWSLLPFRTDLKTTFILTTQDRRGVKIPHFVTAEVFRLCNQVILIYKPVQQPQEKIKVQLLQWDCAMPYLFLIFFAHLQNDLARDKIHLRTQEGICQRWLLQKEGPSIAACSHRSLQSTLHWTH